MQPTRSTAVDLAEVSRVVVNVKKVRDVKLWDDSAVVLLVAERSALVANLQVRTGQADVGSMPPAATSGSLAQIMQCIKDAESGNYSESSHPDSGSGAYQVIPQTWTAWSARAGYSGYAYAYQAPPAVQDAVVLYMLTNGGAGNWSPRYGADSCTVGMGG